MNWVNSCIAWDIERNNIAYEKMNEYDMLASELQELFDSETDNEEVDALCDIIKIAISAIWKKGYDPDDAMHETLKEINSRRQDQQQKEIWDNWGQSGKWLKDINQDDSTKYNADYEKARRLDLDTIRIQ